MLVSRLLPTPLLPPPLPPIAGTSEVGVDGGLLWLPLLWLLVQLLFVGGFEVDLRFGGGPTLVGDGVIGGSSPSSRGLIGGVFITLLRKTYGFSFKSSSSISSAPPPPKRGDDRLLFVHFLFASGVEKLRPNRLLPDDDAPIGAKFSEDGGIFGGGD